MRRRIITPVTPSNPLDVYADAYHLANNEANLAKKRADELRAKLLEQMDALGVEEHVTPSGLRATVKCSEQQKIIPARLLEAVGDVARVLNVCTVSKEAASQVFPSNMLSKCMESVKGARNVTVKKA